jgi:hypothetical protein
MMGSSFVDMIVRLFVLWLWMLNFSVFGQYFEQAKQAQQKYEGGKPAENQKTRWGDQKGWV